MPHHEPGGGTGSVCARPGLCRGWRTLRRSRVGRHVPASPSRKVFQGPEESGPCMGCTCETTYTLDRGFVVRSRRVLRGGALASESVVGARQGTT